MFFFSHCMMAAETMATTRILKGTIQRALRMHVISVYFHLKLIIHATDQSDCSLITISLSDVYKLNQSHEAVGWYTLKDVKCIIL